ncbi:hypothetical protein DF185_09355 [Marinifilum breve]|uniref:Fibrobacter succinogenes major paralogous domain-containing protein n=1 Tax=Marinifilum breve TaxID=2184082 RepID=A0A2V4ACC0_9BACT|nr:hypothetical protein [Marinifilum breve]PXY01664.1 hypothetical protein DF185_09355 [Marinifilum breve]
MKKILFLFAMLAIVATTKAQECDPVCPKSITVQHVKGDISAETVKITYETAEYQGQCFLTKNLGAKNSPTSLGNYGPDVDGWYFRWHELQGYVVGDAKWADVNNRYTDAVTDATDPCTQLLGAPWAMIPFSVWESFRMQNITSSVLQTKIKVNGASGLLDPLGNVINRSQGYYLTRDIYSLSSPSYQGDCYLVFSSGSAVAPNYYGQNYGLSVRCSRSL